MISDFAHTLNLRRNMPCLRILRGNFQNLLSYLESRASNLSKCKVWCKMSLKFETKMLFLGALGLQFEKILPYLKSVP